MSTSTSHSAVAKQRRKFAGLCGVCGDFARCHHFGGLSCNGCKSFFRRAVRNSSFTNFVCANSAGNCSILKTNRNNCRRCRFNRCRQIGMDPVWVLDEIDNHTARIPKQTLTVNSISTEERECIQGLIKSFSDAVLATPYQLHRSSKPSSWKNLQSASILTSSTLYTLRFLNAIPEFRRLSKSSANLLFFSGVQQINVLRTAFAFDAAREAWPSEHTVESFNVYPPVPLSIMDECLSPKILETMRNTVRKVQGMHLDEPSVLLMMLIILFNPVGTSLVEDVKLVEEMQDKMSIILKKYIHWRHGGTAGATYAKFLTMAADLQEMSDISDENHVFLDESQVEIFQNALGEFNPFKIYSIRRPSTCCEDDEIENAFNYLDYSSDLSVSLTEARTDGTDIDTPDLFTLLDDLENLF